MSTIILIVAFACFLLAAFGVTLGKVMLTPLGLALICAAWIVIYWPGRSPPP